MKQHRYQISGVSLALIGGTLLLLGGYLLQWQWTGFPQKTLWDWLQLLVVPAFLAIASYLFTQAERRRERAAEEQKAEAAEQKAAAERQAAEQKTQWERHR